MTTKNETQTLAGIAEDAEEGQDFDTCAEHLRRMADLNPEAMVCILKIGGKASMAIHAKDHNEMCALWVGMAATPDLQPYIMTAAEIIIKEMNDSGRTGNRAQRRKMRSRH